MRRRQLGCLAAAAAVLLLLCTRLSHVALPHVHYAPRSIEPAARERASLAAHAPPPPAAAAAAASTAASAHRARGGASPTSAHGFRPRACPPHTTGALCDQPLFPSCASQWGMPTLVPFVAPADQFPVSCECLLECDALGHGARIDCLQPTATLPLRGRKSSSGAELPPLNLSLHTPPWFGHPREVDRVWTGALQMRYDPAMAATLEADAVRSRSSKACDGAGIHTRVVFSPPPTHRQPTAAPPPPPPPPRCLCLPGHRPTRDGQGCVRDGEPASACVNRCRGAGRCTLGVCVCEEGRAGIDCSAATPDPQTVAAGGRAALSPLIYVYELPAHLNAWVALPKVLPSGCTDSSCWWLGSDPVYSVDIVLLRRLLQSPHRTLDPEKADYFYVPLLNSMGFHSHKFGIYMPSKPAADLIAAVVEHIRTAHPYWNRSGGSDHLFPFTGDDGATWLRGRMPLLNRSIFVTHWGYVCNDPVMSARNPRKDFCLWQEGFRSFHSGQDIVLPPLHRPDRLLPSSPWLLPPLVGDPRNTSRAASALTRLLFPSNHFKYLLYFVGKVKRDPREGDLYSHGVRQRVFERWNSSRDFYLRERPNPTGSEEDLQAMRHSKFCLAPHGTGFGMRQFDAIAAGCVPLIIRVPWENCKYNGGLLEQAFEELLPWASFALYLNRSQIPYLDAILRDFPADRLAALRRGVACVWPRLYWLHRFTGSEPLEPVPKDCGHDCAQQLAALAPSDSFGTFLWLLRRRLQKPRLPAAFELPAASGRPWLLREQSWLTPARSCMAALQAEKQLETEGKLPAVGPTLNSHGVF
ncbi:hypothetical protein AB1Y20_017931 [Prymnesium parvum]|uniref:Exostosin GT47 domain-containing protein n=1 Tax=Prymnesium parvum TaxID=97485 RepID=A0AB34JQF0_PRYPA